MDYIDVEMNENDLVNMYDKNELKELLEIQIKCENYEGAIVVKSAIDQYDFCHSSDENSDEEENTK